MSTTTSPAASANLIVITGITGKQGGSVAHTFLSAAPHWRIRGVTRDPSSASSQHWRSLGVEVVRGDLDDVTSLASAFAGATAVFGVTDFWTPMASPQNQAQAQERGISINEWCYDLELRRGKNLARAAAGTEGLRRYVFSSLSEARRWSGGKYGKVWHFDAKGAVGRWIREDAGMRELSAKTSFLQVGYYLDNWSFIKGDIRGDRDDGFYHAGLGNVEEKIPFIWAQRDTGPLVKTLVEVEAGVNLLGYSELLTWKEYMQMWGRVLGVKLGGDCGSGYKSVSAEEIKAGIQGPEEMKMEALESMQYVQEFGWTGGEPGVLHPKDLGADKYTSRVEDYITKEDWTPLLSGDTHRSDTAG